MTIAARRKIGCGKCAGRWRRGRDCGESCGRLGGAIRTRFAACSGACCGTNRGCGNSAGSRRRWCCGGRLGKQCRRRAARRRAPLRLADSAKFTGSVAIHQSAESARRALWLCGGCRVHRLLHALRRLRACHPKFEDRSYACGRDTPSRGIKHTATERDSPIWGTDSAVFFDIGPRPLGTAAIDLSFGSPRRDGAANAEFHRDGAPREPAFGQ